MKNGEVIIRFQETFIYGPRVWVNSEKCSPALTSALGALSIWGSYDKVEVIDNERHIGFEFRNNADIISALEIIFE